MLRRARHLLVVALFASACGGSEGEDALDRALRLRAEARSGKERLEHVAVVARRGEEAHAFRAILKSERCYAVVAVGEAGIRSIDLRLFDPLGATVDKQKTDAPIIELCTKRAGPYRITMTVAGRGRVRAAVYQVPPVADGEGGRGGEKAAPRLPSTTTVPSSPEAKPSGGS